MNRLFSVNDKVLRRRNLRTVCSEVVLLLASAFFFAMAHPSFLSKNGFGFLAFFVLIPVFAVIRNTSWKLVGAYGFLYGFVYYAIFNYWLTTFHPFAILIVTIIKGAEMLILFFALKAMDEYLDDVLSGSLVHVLQAVIWVAYAYISQGWFAGYPYGSIAYALHGYKILIQVADLFGIWGLTFMLVLPQAFLGNWACDHFSKTRTEHSEGLWQHILLHKICAIAFAVLLLGQIVYGIITYSHWSNVKEDKSFEVATIQHNADSWKGGYETYKRNFINLQKMSLEAILYNPDMVIWSETAFVPSVNWYTSYPYQGNDQGAVFDYLRDIQGLVNDFVKFGSELGTPLLTGNPSSVIKDPTLPPYDEDGNWNKLDYNSVILFDEGSIKTTYLKQHLVPFTEHFPYEKQMPWLYNLLKANDYHWWEKGTESVVFETSNGIKFSTPICYEDVFGDICAEFVENGADLIINMTNDSWSGSEAAERQHMVMAVFRSIENRRTVLRGTNSGMTCLITPDGKIQGEMEPFKMGYKIWNVPVFTGEKNGSTLYTRTIDISAKICVYISYASIICAIALCILKVVRKRKEKAKNA
ncbi:MAG: apolipoprotein N-acyltransferase [Spirochaetales bacterium]|nr:apolipoprotein N-acyltransferase [Spirochaetales bacterium]MBP5756601.1 apolipoprotein N-acyltransferase [Spirochaetales bacterium]